MRIAELHMRNWLRYRGEHKLELEARTYAIVAQDAANPERSNWLGKSSIPEAVDFALHGRHRHRTEDEWITRGERVGEVRLVLDSGDQILRRRERGKRTTLMVTGPCTPANQPVGGAEAQALIEKILGLTPKDFEVTSYFSQRNAARLITARPEERMAIVSEWLRLGPIEACAELVSAEMSIWAEKERTVVAALDNLERMEAEALAEYGSRERLEEAIEEAAASLEKAKGVYARAQDAVAKNALKEDAAAKVREFDALVREGRALRDEVEGANGPALAQAHRDARAAYEETAAVHNNALRVLREKSQVARGQFDGRCPVAGISCPARDEINADTDRAARAYDAAAEAEAAARKESDAAHAAEYSARIAEQEHTRREARLQSMREQAGRLEAGYEKALEVGDPEDPELLRLRVREASEWHDSASRAHATAMARAGTVDGARRRRASLETDLEAARAKLVVYREAAVIFGKSGAQRRVAEGGLAEIEAGANEALAAAGVDLSVKAQWSREGTGLAKACDACGNPYPASARAKVCARCGAGRGPNVVHKLEIVLSDVSAAAEDLAGLTFQLASSGWLREERDSSWETAMLDEPFAHCDRANRMGLARYLASALPHFGFRQAFVISHTADTAGLFGARIEITETAEGPRVRVVG